ncbi:hypothetical protein NEF87_000943 [Candidatus Lokiarchaeum ossiferum]|uniref:Uncharacterized protein n=1 Tax=Candidatus Lokiarchaeum ossiferum TaxID=2951803 RepID=A0ABY6HMX6_9ARCH|nr:hypothetical protein NEF87_000943 [Candidatus Lokiarchaeum sp. B-35]
MPIEINFNKYLPSGATFYAYYSILKDFDVPNKPIDPIGSKSTTLLDFGNYI